VKLLSWPEWWATTATGAASGRVSPHRQSRARPVAQCFHVIAYPCLASLGISAPQHLWVAANQYGLYELIADHHFRGFTEFAVKSFFQESGLFASDLGTRKWQEIHDSMRPAKLSETCGRVRILAEPVNRKRPGRRSSSTDFLTARRRSGTRCTSSIVVRSSPRTKPVGSLRAAASSVSSSRVMYSDCPRQIADQCCLAALAGTSDHDNWCVLECGGHEFNRKAGKECVLSVSHSGCKLRPIRINDASISDYKLV